MNNCLKCGQAAKAKFCTKSCANSYNNSKSPKRKPEHACAVCGAKINARRKYCSTKCKVAARPYSNTFYQRDDCQCGNKKHKTSLLCQSCSNEHKSLLTLGELKEKSVRHAQVYNALRQRSRKIAMKTMDLKCQVCSWSEHVEVCHIIPLCELPNETTVDDATNIKNFILLCPNHHWKFDHDEMFHKALVAGVEPATE